MGAPHTQRSPPSPRDLSPSVPAEILSRAAARLAGKHGVPRTQAGIIHGGDLADQWKSALAPAEVVSYRRFSASLEHADWLWIRLPWYINRKSV
jgi:hypothetical protein